MSLGLQASGGTERCCRAAARGQRFREISGQIGWGIVAWVAGIAFFLPVLWMVLTAFKPESAAETWPPKFTFSPPWPSSGWSSRAGARS